MFVASKGHFELFERILKGTANPSHTNKSGQSALTLAVEQRQTLEAEKEKYDKIVELLQHAEKNEASTKVMLEDTTP